VSVVLVVQYEKRMHSVIHVLSSVTYPAIEYLTTLSQKVTIFGEKKYRKKHVSFDFLYTFCVKHFSLCEEFGEYDHKCT